MTAEVISYLLSQENEKEYLQSQMVLQCAPFLKRAVSYTHLTLPTTPYV